MDLPAAGGADAPLPRPPEHPTRVVFLGTPEIAVPPLRQLLAAGFEVVLVVTGEDKRRGRGGQATPTPVKAAAEALGLRVSHDLDDAFQVGADLGVVVAYGTILRRHHLTQLPMVNLHFSLLPRWRGAAPVERAILAGDAVTGVCVMAVDIGLDTGDVYASVEVPVDPLTSAAELAEALADEGAELLVRTLTEGLRDPAPQVGEPVYAAKLHPADLELRWDRPAVELCRIVRVGGAWTTFRGRRLKVWDALAVDDGPTLGPGELDGDRVGTGSGQLRLLEVQPEGKARLDVTAWINGARPEPTDRLGIGPSS